MSTQNNRSGAGRGRRPGQAGSVGGRGGRGGAGRGQARGRGPAARGPLPDGTFGDYRDYAGTTKPSQPTRLPQRAPKPEVDVHDPDGIRLQKLLAGAGIGSRRACERLIEEGHVSVDDQIVTELGIRVDPQRQTVHVDGNRVIFDESKVYYAFYKPTNVVTSMHDEMGRIDIGDYLGEGRKQRLFHVGRLDQDTEGLLLLTNDGELAHRLQHPAYGVPKTYIAQVPGPLERDLGKVLREGVELEDGLVKVDSFKVVDSSPGKAVVEIVIHEGRKHIVRRLLEAVGHPVIVLVRTQVGPVQLGQLKAGKMRPLTRAEIGGLYQAAGL